jgi:Ca2+-binding EF-hand superfamily protein
MDRVGDNKEVHAAFEGWQEGFLQADADQDGQLNVHELTALLQQVSRGGQESMVEESEAEISASIMEGFDTNRDGKIGLQELLDHVKDKDHVVAAFEGWPQGFKEADKDGDGHLDSHELTSLLNRVSRSQQKEMVEESEESIAESVMRAWDADKDGKLTLDELHHHLGDNKDAVNAAFEGWKEGFNMADKDKDGSLTIHELAALLSRVSTKDQHKIVQDVDATTQSLLQGFDADHNGKVTLDEIAAHAGKLSDVYKEAFAEADADKDGGLNAEELANLLHKLNEKSSKHDEM